MNSVFAYIIESYDELLHKVTWPTWGNLISTTKVVLLGTIIVTIIVFFMDGFSSQLLKLIYGM